MAKRPQPFYETNSFWGFLALAIAIVTTVLAAMIHDLRWLLIVAWPFFVGTIWTTVKGLKKRRVRFLSIGIGSLLVAFGLYRLNVALRPPTTGLSQQPLTEEQIESAVKRAIPQSQPPQTLATRAAEPSAVKASSPSPKEVLPHYTKPAIKQRPYDLTGERRKQFLELLEMPQSEQRDTIRIGCIAWSDAACVAAGKFLILFSEAGWTIDSNRVFRMEPEIPIEGMAMVSHTDDVSTLRTLPPHMGIWQSMDASQVRIWAAFTTMGIPVSSSVDPSLPKGKLGIYFGPEPQEKTREAHYPDSFDSSSSRSSIFFRSAKSQNTSTLAFIW